MQARVSIDRGTIEFFCQRHGIRELSLFGSVLRDDFGPDSDVDVLVEFEPGRSPSMFRLARIERELAAIVGRRVDLVTRGSLSPYIAPKIEAGRDVLYVRSR